MTLVLTQLPIGIRERAKLDWREEALAWELYSETFREINALAVQRHLMKPGEFADVGRDERVIKYLAYEEPDPPEVDDNDRTPTSDRVPARWNARMVGVATYTNDLESMPLISPAYFERRWPELYAQQRIWYCGFVAVHPDAPTGTFSELIKVMANIAIEARGLISLDMCRHNDEIRRLSRVVALMLHRLIGGVRVERLDEQSYWLYDVSTQR